MDEVCQRCGKTISRRAKANVWNGSMVVCTPCRRDLEAETQRGAAAIAMAGTAGAAWLVYDGTRQYGPFPTAQLVELLSSGRVNFLWQIWRDGMSQWRAAGQLFTIAELSNGRIELRDFGQGDGTYRP
ncbi:MAG TPA: DUF4339 domain-containing protein [Tepidisphaeraceae bacterium]